MVISSMNPKDVVTETVVMDGNKVQQKEPKYHRSKAVKCQYIYNNGLKILVIKSEVARYNIISSIGPIARLFRILKM